MLKVLALGLLSLLAGSQVEGRVVKVLDGDTIDILSGLETRRIRLYGVDAPEKKQDFGQVSKTFTASICAGKDVKVKIMDTDRYGRSIGLVYVDGVNLNEKLVAGGAAWVYSQYCREDFCTQWKVLEERARSHRVGLWAAKSIPPWPSAVP
jgi:endonuclease YncB( thermonuclease family)